MTPIEGLTILSHEATYAERPLFIIITVAGFLLTYWLLFFCCGFGTSTKTIIICIVIGACMFFTGIVLSNTSKKYDGEQYYAIISENMPYIEFDEHYTVKEKHNDVWVIKDKETSYDNRESDRASEN